jgi:hypothetical protein
MRRRQTRVAIDGFAKQPNRLVETALPSADQPQGVQRAAMPRIDCQHGAIARLGVGQPALVMQPLGIREGLRDVRARLQSSGPPVSGHSGAPVNDVADGSCPPILADFSLRDPDAVRRRPAAAACGYAMVWDVGGLAAALPPVAAGAGWGGVAAGWELLDGRAAVAAVASGGGLGTPVSSTV